MLRMGIKTAFDDFRDVLRTRWQMPLFVVALVLLGVAFFRVQRPEPVPTFEEYVRQIEALHKGGFLTEANQTLQGLLQNEGWSKAQRATLFQLLAETIYLAEAPKTRHDPENVERIIRNHRAAIAEGMTPTPSMHEQMGQAMRWLGKPDLAVKEFQKAIAAGSKRSGSLRRTIVEMLPEVEGASPEQAQAQVRRMLENPSLEAEDLLWALEKRVEQLIAENKLDEIKALLETMQDRMLQAGLTAELDYLRARVHFLKGEYAQAERMLLDLRNKLDPVADLSTKVNWLLGRTHFSDGRPQEALEVFREIVRRQPSGEYYLAGRLGMAECLAALHHIDEAADIYEEVAGMAARYTDGQIVDRDAVRASLTSLYALLRAEGRLEAGARFLRLATALVPPDDLPMEASYLRRLADLYASIGESRLAQVRPTRPGTSRPATGPPVFHRSTAGTTSQPSEYDQALTAAHEMFRRAGETYLRLSRIPLLDVEEASEAAWLAGVQFDRANMPERMIDVMEDFLVTYSKSPRVPEVLYRLGQAFQALGRYQEAIARYAESQSRYPRTPAAMRSLVPMAQCHMALGPEHYPEAERVLQIIVEQPPDKGRYDPKALEFREALFAIAELYDRWGKPAQAISRLEEFLERYPKDPRETQIQFMLANAYRKSGLALLGAKADAVHKDQQDAAQIGTARLQRAEELFSEVIHSLGSRPFDSLSGIQQVRLKYSHLYRADCVFDLGDYERALSLYEGAARRFRRDPISMAAYVQVFNCYLRLGREKEARATVQRVKWLLKGIPPAKFEAAPGEQSLAYWEGFLGWLEKSGVFKQ